MREPRQAGHLPGRVSRFASNTNPQALHRAGSTWTRCPAARADRTRCARSSSMSLRRKSRALARLDALRGPAARISIRCRRNAIARVVDELIRGALPLGLPDTLSRSRLRRLAPFAWLTRDARSRVGL